MDVLEVKSLGKTYGGRKVVDGVSFRVAPGEIVGLLGPNGAGKSTSFRMTCGLVDPDKGTVRLNDQEVTRWPFYRRAREGGMGYLPQQTSVFAKLSTEQNLLAMMELLGMGRRERLARCEELLEQFRITHIRKSKAGKLSGGEKRRLEIARCLVSEPEIIMLDEPFAGIDPVTVQSIQGIIRELRDHGISILITDHAAREILQITDRTYVISEGQVLCSGTADQIVAHEEVKRKYLGEIDSFAPSPTSIKPPQVTASFTPASYSALDRLETRQRTAPASSYSPPTTRSSTARSSTPPAADTRAADSNSKSSTSASAPSTTAPPKTSSPTTSTPPSTTTPKPHFPLSEDAAAKGKPHAVPLPRRRRNDL